METGTAGGTIVGFGTQDFSLVQFYWEQGSYDDGVIFRIGEMDPALIWDGGRYVSSNYAFFSPAFSDTLPMALPEARLEDWFLAGVEAVAPQRALAHVIEGERDTLSIAGQGIPSGSEIVAIAIGKAACAMAREFEARAGSRIRAGLAITKDDHALPLAHFAVRLAGHPLPDARSAAAAREALALAAGCSSCSSPA